MYSVDSVVFMGLQRDIPFAILSKDPPPALLWLSALRLVWVRNMQAGCCDFAFLRTKGLPFVWHEKHTKAHKSNAHHPKGDGR